MTFTGDDIMTRILSIAAVTLLVLAPMASAGEPPATTPSDTSSTTQTSPPASTSTSSSASTSTTTTPPTTTTTPPTTTTTTTPTTTTTTTPTSTATGIPGGSLPDIPENDACITSIAACDDLPVGGEGVGPSPAYGAGGLPFTGIEDFILPLLLGIVALLGGVIAYRYATVRERLARMIRASQERAANRRVTGYTWALHNMDADSRTVSFWTGQRSDAA